tara:strand:+ start:427 stop:837 length:411 start_codon:yes stop_codon:yes gene_type:complete
MHKLSTITVKFQGNKAVKFKNTTLLEIAKRLLNQQTFVNLQPMLIVFPTGKQLYFNKSEWHQFLHNQISVVELVENTETEGLYRNNNVVVFKGKLDVEPQALWTKKGNQLFLIDDDWNIIVDFNKKIFTEILTDCV